MFDAKSLLNMVMGAGQQMMQKGQGGSTGAARSEASAASWEAFFGGQSRRRAAAFRRLSRAECRRVAQAFRMWFRKPGRHPERKLCRLCRTGEGHAPEQRGSLMAGGLAGLALGTKTGRLHRDKAAMLGGLALVGGLAYKALQNYKQGKR